MVYSDLGLYGTCSKSDPLMIMHTSSTHHVSLEFFMIYQQPEGWVTMVSVLFSFDFKQNAS
jgi:hypothetical protein